MPFIILNIISNASKLCGHQQSLSLVWVSRGILVVGKNVSAEFYFPKHDQWLWLWNGWHWFRQSDPLFVLYQLLRKSSEMMVRNISLKFRTCYHQHLCAFLAGAQFFRQQKLEGYSVKLDLSHLQSIGFSGDRANFTKRKICNFGAIRIHWSIW